MQTAGFISEYLLLDISHQRISTSQQRFDTGVSISSFDLTSLRSFIIKLESCLPNSSEFIK